MTIMHAPLPLEYENIPSYTMLISTALTEGERVAYKTESRVIVKIDGKVEGCALSQVTCLAGSA